MKIGVLALQGAVREHIRHIELSGHEGIAVKKVEQLDEIDGLILPGGESTTLRRLMDLYGFKEKLQQSDLPIFGTCAGLIVLAKDVEGETGYLKKLDITVERNSFGRQVDSFEAELDIKGIAEDIEGVFIRAPHIANEAAHENAKAFHDKCENAYLGCWVWGYIGSVLFSAMDN
ncbi:pyridoxal 5'-phosphate synthase glutaminase subunit PdxT, partial [Staphylococcus haemolyticus]